MKYLPRPRFSLRALLLLMVAIAVWLGLAVSRAQRETQAVDVVTALGGSVYYDYHLREVGTTITLCPTTWRTGGDTKVDYPP